MASFRERLAKWETASTPLTPEAQERKIREAREKQREAVRLARARASRYNMTLRAISIKSVREQAEMKKQDQKAIEEAKERAMKYSMTSRALSLVAGKNQRQAARAFDPTVSPRIARQVVEAAAMSQATANAKINSPGLSEKKRITAATTMLEQLPESDSEEEEEQAAPAPAAKAPAKVEEDKADKQEEEQDADEKDDDDKEEAAAAAAEEEEEEEAAAQDDKGDDDAKEEEEEETVIVMEDLAKAVAQGDEDGVNRAILKEFLEEHAPHRVGEVDDLLKQYEGSKVDVLFQELIETYPDPAEATSEGEQSALEKAMMRAAEDMEADSDYEPKADSAGEEEEEDDEPEEELSAVEQQKRDAKAAEKREKEKIAAMSEEERMDYFKAKEEERKHQEEKDKMLKHQLDLYATGGSKKNPVLGSIAKRLSSSRGAAKRLSKDVERRESTKSNKSREPSIAAEGFILSAKVSTPSSVGDRDSVNRASSKWAVNVQPQLLRERMKKAGVAEKDIDALMSEESDML